MTMSEQLWIESSSGFSLPGFPNHSGSPRWAAPKMRALFWPSGLICWQVNLYLVSLRKSGLAISTVNTYASELSVFIRYLARCELSIDEIDDDTLIEYADYLLVEGKSGNHINRLLLRILNYLGWYQGLFPGVRVVGPVGADCQVTVKIKLARACRGKISTSLQHMSMVPASTPRTVRPISYQDLKTLVSACDKPGSSRFKKTRDRCMITLLADTGIRREEITWIFCDSILEAEKNGGRLRIRTSKKRGNPEREVPIPQETLSLLVEYVEVTRAMHIRRLKKRDQSFQDSGWAFCSHSGGKMAPVTVSQLFNDLRKSSSIQGRATPHMLRHRYITLQVMGRLKALHKSNLGLEMLTTVLSQVASLTGHSSLDSLWTYVDWAFEELDTMRTSGDFSENPINAVVLQLMNSARSVGDKTVVDALETVQKALNDQSVNHPELNVVTHSVRCNR